LLISLLDLNTFFGDRTVGDIKAQLCRDFVDWCTNTENENNIKAKIAPRARVVSDQTARRRLEDLRAAVNAYHAEHTLDFLPRSPIVSDRISLAGAGSTPRDRLNCVHPGS
jgi:hypothetical protein